MRDLPHLKSLIFNRPLFVRPDVGRHLIGTIALAYRWQYSHTPAPADKSTRLRYRVMPYHIVFIRKNGAAYVTRTRDPIITNDVLYRLS